MLLTLESFLAHLSFIGASRIVALPDAMGCKTSWVLQTDPKMLKVMKHRQSRCRMMDSPDKDQPFVKMPLI